MKKTFAILLLAVMLFNLVGYRMFFSVLDSKADADMVAQLDNHHYSYDGLVEIKIPLHLPYTSNSIDFERYDGTIELNGVSYNYVERKLVNDTLILHCLPNTQKNQLKSSESEYARTASDVQQPQQGHKNNSSILLKGFFFLYSNSNNAFVYTLPALQAKMYKAFNTNLTYNQPSKGPEQPPDFI